MIQPHITDQSFSAYENYFVYEPELPANVQVTTEKSIKENSLKSGLLRSSEVNVMSEYLSTQT